MRIELSKEIPLELVFETLPILQLHEHEASSLVQLSIWAIFPVLSLLAIIELKQVLCQFLRILIIRSIP